MSRLYLQAPLPFVGQKRMFARKFINVLASFSSATTFVDLFGGSGLLSHITKHTRPDATVVYNDYDNYRRRLEAIPQTNRLLADIRAIVGERVPRQKLITGDIREQIFQRIEQEEDAVGYVDFITISSSLMFSMRYRLNISDLRREPLYNNVRKTDYPPCPDYLDGLEIVSCDYKELFRQYADVPDTVFLVDPPYLSTEVGTYTMHWRMSDYLDVLNVLNSRPFVYFTSNKSSILELCEWIGNNKDIGNPFENARKIEFNAHMNFMAQYTDIMLFKT